MRLTRDEELTIEGQFGMAVVCRLRVWQEAGRTSVVVLGKPAQDYLGPSVTNCIENLATAAYRQLGEPKEGILVIQHYPPEFDHKGRVVKEETFDLMAFAHTPQGFTDPRWTRLEREQVERLVGQRLPKAPQAVPSLRQQAALQGASRS